MPTSYAKTGLAGVPKVPVYTAPTPSNVSATSKTPTVTTPPTKASTTSQAGSNYVNSLLGDTGVKGSTVSTPPATPLTLSGTPQSQMTDTQSARQQFIDAYKAYQTAQTQTADLSAAKKAYNDFLANQAKSISAKEGQGRGIPLEIVRGQQRLLLDQTQPEAQRLQGEIGIAQEDFTRQLDAAKSGVDLQAQLLTADKTNLPASAQEYEYAKKQGYTGTFQQYQNEDANRKAIQQGLTPSQINSTVNTIAGAFDNEPIVKEYNTVKTTLDALKRAGSSPTDDIQRIYAFAKIMDPNSVVREGEYKTVQDYSTALLQRIGINIKRAFDAQGFLTAEARANMEKTLGNIMAAKQASYDNLASQYQRQIDDAYSGKNRTITNYAGGGQTGGSGGLYDF